MYESTVCGVEDVKEFLELCNQENYRIISAVFISTTEQMLFVTQRSKPILKKEEKEEPEEEE